MMSREQDEKIKLIPPAMNHAPASRAAHGAGHSKTG